MDQGPDGGEVDVAIIGGSFAGLAAALYLARARRRLAVFDHGRTRNRFAPHAHGFLGQDGRPPAAIRLAGRAEVLAYPTATLREARVTAVTGQADAFAVVSEGAPPLRARRVILAHGMTDRLPDLPGLEACWGVTAIGCPYCHGFELADRPTGVLMTAPHALHQARLLREWTADLVLLANGHRLSDEDRRDLGARGLRVEDAPVEAVEHEAGRLRAVRLAGGGRVPLEALYLAPRAAPSAPFAADLGCALEEGPLGPYVRTEDSRATSVPGVFAAGDLTRPMYGSLLAAADGMIAGTACHRSLLDL